MTIRRVYDDPKVRSISGKTNTLTERSREIEKRITILEEQCRAAMATDSRAVGLLEDPSASIEDFRTPLAGELRGAREEQRVVAQTLKLGERELAQAVSDVSAEICREMRPYYTDLVERTFEVLDQLAALAGEQDEFRRRLDAAGVSHGVLPALRIFHLVGLTRDPHALLHLWKREAREHGLLDE